MIYFVNLVKKHYVSCACTFGIFLTMNSLNKMNHQVAAAIFCFAFIAAVCVLLFFKSSKMREENYKNDDTINKYFRVFSLWSYSLIYLGVFKVFGLEYYMIFITWALGFIFTECNYIFLMKTQKKYKK